MLKRSQELWRYNNQVSIGVSGPDFTNAQIISWIIRFIRYNIQQKKDHLEKNVIKKTENVLTTTECVSLSSLRKSTGDLTFTLEKWLENPKNIYVGRRSKFTTKTGDVKTMFFAPVSKYSNPYPKETAELYYGYFGIRHLKDTVEELRGKNLGCTCNQNEECHAKMIAGYLNGTLTKEQMMQMNAQNVRGYLEAEDLQ